MLLSEATLTVLRVTSEVGSDLIRSLLLGMLYNFCFMKFSVGGLLQTQNGRSNFEAKW